MFVLLFAYVFGSAIDVPGVGYKEFLIAGIFAQTVVFGSTFTGYSLAEDLQKGIIDRFRSLPMAPSAVLFGRTFSDVVINVISLAVMAVTGLLVGWRITTSVLGGGRSASLVLLAFAYADLLGDGLRRPAGADPGDRQQRGVHRHLPADVHRQHVRADQRFPEPLKTFANWNPVSAVTQAARELFGNTSPALPPPDVWPMQNPVAYSLIWSWASSRSSSRCRSASTARPPAARAEAAEPAARRRARRRRTTRS